MKYYNTTTNIFYFIRSKAELLFIRPPRIAI